MILKFNLIPKEKVKTFEEEPFSFIKAIGIVTGIIVLVFLIIFTALQYESFSLKKELQKEKLKLEKFSYIAKQVKHLKAISKNVEERITVMLGLKNFQESQLRKLGVLLYNINKNKVYFVQLKFSPESATIKGLSEDIDYLANYLKKLKKANELVSQINLLSVNKEKGYIKFDVGVNFKSNQ